MADRIDIEIKDNIDNNIAKKISSIGLAARQSDRAIKSLQDSLNLLTPNVIKLNASNAKLINATARLENATSRAAFSKQKLATETERTRVASERANAAYQRTAAATSRAEIAALRLAQTKDRLAKSIKRTSGSLTGFLRQIATFSVVTIASRRLIGLADSYTLLQNKLKVVTDSSTQLANVTNRVFQIANKARVPVNDAAVSFQRFDLALKQLGASQEETLRLTETISKSFTISGATTQEASQGLRQLSQAFNKGKLDGDEFRTTMEAAPLIADALAKQLGVTRGELLKLAPQGKITGQVMREALANAASDIDKQFSKLTPTISQSLIILKNNFIKTFGEIEKRYGLFNKLGKTIEFVANNIDLLLIPSLAAATLGIKAITVAIATNPIGAIVTGVIAAATALYAFRNEIKFSSDGVLTLSNTFQAAFELISQNVLKVKDFFVRIWEQAFGDINETASNFEVNLIAGLLFYLDAAKKTINSFIGLWIGAFNTIIKGWSKFPSALKDIAVLASNFFVSTIEKMINGVLDALNEVLKLVNQASEFLGGGKVFSASAQVDLSAFKGKISGAASEIGKIASEEFNKAFSTDFVGDAVNAINTKAREIAARKKREVDKAPDFGKLRGPSGTEGSGGYELPKGLDTYSKDLKEVGAQQEQLGEAYSKSAIGLSEYETRMRDLNVQTSELKLKMGEGNFGDVMTASIGKVTEGFTTMLAGVSESFGTFFVSLRDGFANSIGQAIVYGDDLNESLRNVARQGIAELISGLVKTGIQFVITEGIKRAQTTATGATIQATTAATTATQTAALAAQTTASTSAAVATTAAWTPAAATSSIASFGGAAAIGVAALIAALALFGGKGFKEGGYTGDIGRNQIAGVTHGEEFVMNAGATQRLGKSELYDLQRGAARIQKYGDDKANVVNSVGSNNSVTQNQSGNQQTSQVNLTNVNVLSDDVFESFIDSGNGNRVLMNFISKNRQDISQTIRS